MVVCVHFPSGSGGFSLIEEVIEMPARQARQQRLRDPAGDLVAGILWIRLSVSLPVSDLNEISLVAVGCPERTG